MSEEPDGLVDIIFGLQPFVHEQHCPKCGAKAVRVVYHGCLMLNVGDKAFPCGAWFRSGILTGDIGEHLCLRCNRCAYGWPTQTADTYRTPPLENPEDPDTDLGELM